jgi:hypothetical protein
MSANLDSLRSRPVHERAPTPKEIEAEIINLTARLEIVRRATGTAGRFNGHGDMDEPLYHTSILVDTPRGQMEARLAVEAQHCGLCGARIRPGATFTIHRSVLCWPCNPGVPSSTGVRP